jgi:hypothetical protein
MSAAAKRKHSFLTAGTATAPTAEPAAPAATPEPEPAAKPRTSRRTAVKTPAPAADKPRIAYTWRRTPEQVLAMDELMIRLKRETGRPQLDHSAVLAALVELATDSKPVFGALTARLQ